MLYHFLIYKATQLPINIQIIHSESKEKNASNAKLVFPISNWKKMRKKYFRNKSVRWIYKKHFTFTSNATFINILLRKTLSFYRLVFGHTMQSMHRNSEKIIKLQMKGGASVYCTDFVIAAYSFMVYQQHSLLFT